MVPFEKMKFGVCHSLPPLYYEERLLLKAFTYIVLFPTTVETDIKYIK